MSKKKIEVLQQDNYLDEELQPVISFEKDEKLINENKKLKSELEKIKKENEEIKAELSKVEEVDNSSKEEVETYINLAKRIQADFDNYRKRNNDTIKQSKDEGVASAIRALLPCIDAIYRAIGYTKDQDTLMGLKMVSDKFESCLSSLGVRKYESLGKPFDASLHSAVSSMEKADVNPNTVIEEIESGYMIGDKVLRYALVVISK